MADLGSQLRQSEVREIQVPLSLLLSSELTPAAKFLWIRLRFDEMRSKKRSHRPRQLEKRTCLARSTIYEALRQGEAAGWLARCVDSASGKLRWKTALPGGSALLGKGAFSAGELSDAIPNPGAPALCADGRGRNRTNPVQGASDPGHQHSIARRRAAGGRALYEGARVAPRTPGRPVRIPVDLIRAAHALRPQAILCYGLLQATRGFNGRTGAFKWAELRQLTGLHLRTIKRAVRALAEARWISIAQEHRRAPIWFRLQHADHAYKEEAEARLERAGYLGEALMRSFLSLIVDSKECEDGARPEFLVNPATGERLEFDRYYPIHRVAFEFNGPQHYIATGPFSKSEVAAQRKRDRLKEKICKEKGINLVIVHAEDLTLRQMFKMVRALLPLRALRGFRETIRFLNRCGMRYLAAARAK